MEMEIKEPGEQQQQYTVVEVEEGMMKKARITNKYVRQFLAEFLGTFALVIFGDGAVAQWSLSAATGGNKGGDFIHVCLGYGLGLMIGIFISGGVSGGHLNPAVTISMAAINKLKWIQVPIYMAAQYLGAFFASLVLLGNVAEVITLAEKSLGGNGTKTLNTAGIFSSFPSYPTEQVGLGSLAMDQMLGTALLLLVILAVTDEGNMKTISSMVPLSIGLGLTAIHLSFGLNAGSAINPARDFAPRLLTLIGGWGTPTFSAFNYWFWIPWLLPHIGGMVGAFIYMLMVGIHHPDTD